MGALVQFPSRPRLVPPVQILAGRERLDRRHLAEVLEARAERDRHEPLWREEHMRARFALPPRRPLPLRLALAASGAWGFIVCVSIFVFWILGY